MQIRSGAPVRISYIVTAFLLGLAGAVATVFAFAPKARAAESGCGIQVHGAHAIGFLDAGGPVGLSSTGYMPGGSVFCDLAIGKSMVVGAFAGGEKVFGDLDTIGVKHAFDVGGRVGFVIHPSVLLYGHAAWTRMNVSGLGNIDGWKWGPGMEVQLPASAWSFDMRYQISGMDVSGIDAEVRSVRLGLAWKWGGGKQVESVFAPEVSQPVCDPKLANCKKK